MHTSNEQMERILVAAEQLLAQHELDAHSMAEVAKQAGMSKRTVYGLVGSKAVLIEKIIERVALKALDLLDAKVNSTTEATDLLELFLLSWIKAAHTATAVNLFRLVIDERKSFPDATRDYFALGNIHLRARLTQWLKAQVTKKHLVIPDPAFFADVAADYLVSRPLMGMALNVEFKDGGQKPTVRVERIMKLFGLRQGGLPVTPSVRRETS
ncbi:MULTISPECIES: TetR/AcrR family transcriptional regulator [Luteibacter]|uniref:TetR/AcrR family transcriptional regulator n=1 Tax=Luteibacter TaxID=242605 RepID=UPI00068EFEC5|nr:MULTISPECIES: TetR/AcrR family transcriptional regulator [unclassified Luteibacter]